MEFKRVRRRWPHPDPSEPFPGDVDDIPPGGRAPFLVIKTRRRRRRSFPRTLALTAVGLVPTLGLIVIAPVAMGPVAISLVGALLGAFAIRFLIPRRYAG